MDDTTKLDPLNLISQSYIDIGHYDSAIFYANKTIALSDSLLQNRDKLNNIILTTIHKGTANAYNNIGIVYEHKGDFPLALDYFFRALNIFEDLKDKNRVAAILGNMGIVYWYIGDLSKSLEFFLKALQNAEELGYKQLQANTLANIGILYTEQANLSTNDSLRQTNFSNSLDYCFRALKIKEELGDKNGIARQLGAIGGIYAAQAEIASKKNEANELNNKALDYYFKSLKLHTDLESKKSIATTFANIGSLYTSIKNYGESEKYLLKALNMYKEVTALNDERQIEEMLCELYTETNRYSLALEHYKKAMVLKDTLFNQEKNKDITRKEMNYEFEKKTALAKAEHDKQIAVSEAEAKKQKIIIISVVVGLFLVLVFAGLIFRSLRITKKQKHLIELQKSKVEQQKEEISKQKEIVEEQKTVVEKQKHLVEEHQKEIIDSITYAKRLQQAILPPVELIKKHLPESFLLYKPKDIVAGDFYWMEEKDSIVFIAAADCTGHGVPGAMVSVVCSNALNRTVKEFGLRETGKILDKVTDIVLETFEKSGEQIKDGMDISLLAYNNASKQIQWSGANNSLCYFVGNDLKEIKADKQPIGKHDNRKPFTTHNIEHSDNSVFYLFTDGLPDQFGGPKGKKFLYKRFENNLSDICKLPMDEQQALLDKAFQDWKGSLEQVDDVTVIGIKI